MSKPLVSVVVPTYNRRNWITSCLISIFGQTFRDFEIILIDDGSVDNTKERIRDFFAESKTVIREDETEGLIEKDKLIYYRFEKNGGIPRALNKGYELAKGKYVCQLSSDDIWLYNKLESQIKIMTSNNNIGLIYSDYYFNDFTEIIDNKPKEWIRKTPFGKNDEMFGILLNDCFMNACTFLMTKQFKDHIGIYPLRPEFEWNQDLFFNLMCMIQDKYEIYHQDIPTAKISIHETQASKQGKCGLGNNILIPEMIQLAKEKRKDWWSGIYEN